MQISNQEYTLKKNLMEIKIFSNRIKQSIIL